MGVSDTEVGEAVSQRVGLILKPNGICLTPEVGETASQRICLTSEA
jgi:hypothetical protein